MTITLDNVLMPGDDADKPLFDGLSMHIPDRSRIGILGTSKPANLTLLRLICGTKEPHKGVVRRNVRVSWPIPLAAFFVAGQSLAQNVRFIARLYGIGDEEFPRHIVESVDMGEFLNEPLSKCPKIARGRLAFALGVGLDFDVYLFDGSFAPVDKPYKEKAAQISAARVAGRGFVVATSLPAEVEQNCESVYVLEEGRARYFAVVSEGVERFKELLAAQKKKEQREAQKTGAEEDGEVDVDETAAMTAMAALAVME